VFGGVVLGTSAGLYLGASLTELYRDYYRFPRLDHNLSPEVFGLTIIVSLAAAVLGALGAARHASALPPAEATRAEPARGVRFASALSS